MMKYRNIVALVVDEKGTCQRDTRFWLPLKTEYCQCTAFASRNAIKAPAKSQYQRESRCESW